MKGSLVGTVLVVLAATTAFADPSGGHPSGGSGGGHSMGGAVARSSGGHSNGGGGYAHGGAVPRGYAPGLSPAQRRQPTPGYSSGHGYYGHGSYGHGSYGHGSYGHGYYGHGHGYYGHGHGYYGHPYYGYYGYPYYGYYGSYPWLSLGFYYGGSYGYAAPYYGPSGYVSSYPASGSYPADDSYADEPPPPDRDDSPVASDERHEDGRARGDLRLDVRPNDASVYLDDRFLGSARELHTLALAPGPHRVEVVRPGFRTVERTVQVRPDAPATVVVELARQ